MKPREVLRLKECHPELLKRAIAIEKSASENNRGAIVGLGRDWTWENLVKTDEAQMKLFKAGPKTLCGCYDG